jgi:hypothetical protein
MNHTQRSAVLRGENRNGHGRHGNSRSGPRDGQLHSVSSLCMPCGKDKPDVFAILLVSEA